MGIRVLQPLEHLGASKIFLDQVQENPETFRSEIVSVDQCASLPDSKMTDLKTLVKVGMPLEQVNCKLLNPSGTVRLGPEKKETEKKVTESSIGETKNEKQ